MISPASIRSPKKREQSGNQQDDPTLVVMDTDKLQEKRNKKCGSEEEEIFVFIPPGSDADMSSKKKKKKKKNKEQEGEEEELHVLPEHSVNDSKKKEKQKETLCQESVDTDTADQQDEESDSVLLEITPRKNKKKKKRRQEQEEIHNVPEEFVIETTDQHAGETDSGLLGIKKKKRKEKEEMHAVEEDSVNKDPMVLAETDSVKKKKKKKKKKLVQEEDEMHATEEDSTIKIITETNGVKKKKKKKRRTQEQGEEELHGVEEDSVIEELTETTGNPAGDANPALLAKTNGVKNKRRRTEEEDVEEIHAEEHQNNTNAMVSVGTQMEGKKIKREMMEANIPSKRRAKRVKGTVVTDVTTGSKRGQKRRGQRASPADDVFESKLLDEMEEFLPGIRELSNSKISRLLKVDLPRFRQFKKEGIAVRRGRFSEEENQRIRKNMADFRVLIGISSAEKVVFPERFKEEEQEIKRLRTHHHYAERIAEGIPRVCDQVIIRVRKLFDEGNKMGRYSDEELKTLVKLQNRYGNNWKTISNKMGRSIYSLEKRFSSCTQGRGAWGDDEVSRLKKALREHLEELLQQDPESSGLSRDQLCNNLPWTEISHKVKTRYWTQCRLKWFSLLKTKLGTTGNSTFKRGSKASRAKIKIINTLHNMDLDDQAEIDWHEVANAVGNSTPVCIQKTFLRLKRSKVPHSSNLSFGEIVDFLHDVVVPSLEKDLAIDENEEEEQQEEQLRERRYQLSDIFGPKEGEEFVELDNS